MLNESNCGVLVDGFFCAEMNRKFVYWELRKKLGTVGVPYFSYLWILASVFELYSQKFQKGCLQTWLCMDGKCLLGKG